MPAVIRKPRDCMEYFCDWMVVSGGVYSPCRRGFGKGVVVIAVLTVVVHLADKDPLAKLATVDNGQYGATLTGRLPFHKKIVKP